MKTDPKPGDVWRVTTENNGGNWYVFRRGDGLVICDPVRSEDIYFHEGAGQLAEWLIRNKAVLVYGQ